MGVLKIFLLYFVKIKNSCIFTMSIASMAFNGIILLMPAFVQSCVFIQLRFFIVVFSD